VLGHPWFTGAVAVLAVNDQVLKGRGLPAVTGKLSDLAGVFVVAVVAGVVTGRPRAAIAATGLGFTLLKTAPAAAVLAAPVLGGVTRRDPGDLVALATLYPAWGLLSEPDRADPVGRGRSLLAVPVVGVAVLAVTATSCAPPPAVDAVAVGPDGEVFARVSQEDYDAKGHEVTAHRWAVSRDGGATWARASTPPRAGASKAKQACSTGVGCFRVRSRRVDHAARTTGPYTTAFALTGEQQARIDARPAYACMAGEDHLNAVAIVDRSDGAHVIVAAGSQGALHRSPGSGHWDRVAVLDTAPVSLFGPSWLARLTFVALGTTLLSPIVLLLGRRWGTKRYADTAAGLVLGTGFAVLSLGGGLLFFGLDYVVAGPLTALLAVGAFVASLLLPRHHLHPSRLSSGRFWG
jgi:hypothetical protein